MIIIDMGFRPDKCKVPAKDTKKLYSAACTTFELTIRLFGKSCAERIFSFAADNIREGTVTVAKVREHLNFLADTYEALRKEYAKRHRRLSTADMENNEQIRYAIKMCWADWLTLEQTEALLEVL